MSEVKLQVETLDHFMGNAVDMAKRLDAGERTRGPAYVSFESMESLLKVLTPNRWVLLRTLRSRGPSSIRALAQALGRDYRAVHSDVMMLVEAGLIERDRRGSIAVPWTRILAEMELESAASA